MDNTDNSKRQEIISSLIAVLDSVPYEKIIRLREFLNSSTNLNLGEMKEILGLSGISYSAISLLINNSSISRSLLLMAMDTAISVRNHILKGVPKCELIWTGPIQFSVTARSTMNTMLEMINQSKRKITLVGYRVEEYAQPIINSLSNAMERNISISLILDRAENHLPRLRKSWKYHRLPEIYTMRKNPNDLKQALHAKLIVSDYSNLLVTSANLSYHGLVSNIEIGIKVYGRTAYETQLLLNSLVRDGHLVAVT